MVRFAYAGLSNNPRRAIVSELGRLDKLSEASADLEDVEGCLVVGRGCGSDREGDDDDEGTENQEAEGPDVYELAGWWSCSVGHGGRYSTSSQSAVLGGGLAGRASSLTRPRPR